MRLVARILLALGVGLALYHILMVAAFVSWPLAIEGRVVLVAPFGEGWLDLLTDVLIAVVLVVAFVLSWRDRSS